MGTSLLSGRDDGTQPADGNRAELAAILASDVFKRSPKLSRLLLYLCEKSFQGLAGEITEYGIGVDVLGRDPKFDPQQDALVRVDTHHLRKRLKEYYANAGSGHPIQIALRNGSYAPEFVAGPEITPPAEPIAKMPEPAPVEPPHSADPIVDPPKAAEPVVEPPKAADPIVEPPKAADPIVEPSQSPKPVKEYSGRPSAHRIKLTWIAAGMALVMLSAGWWLVAAGRERPVPASAAPSAGSLASGPAAEIRIAAGAESGDYTDHLGRIWMSDRDFQGGAAFHRGPVQILRTFDGELFRSGREGQFVYNIPLNPGTYELHLYFAETGVASESLRGVSMAINSVPFPTVDVASDAGGVNTATVKIFKNISPAKDGILHLTFLGTGPSFLNGLEIVPGIPGKMRPIRLTARDSVYLDHLGQLWLPDESTAGPRRRSTITAHVEGTPDPGLYQTDRVGHFTYSIPVAEGSRYEIRLHFAEPWFSQADPGGGIGSRVFDVYCNGNTLLKDFDILREAGGGKHAITRVFHGIQASPQGKLELTFLPVTNYALVDAIEIIEE